MTLNCSIQLSNAVDNNPMTVTTMWRKDGVALINSASRWVSGTNRINTSSNEYLSQVVFRPVQLESDNGMYSCEVTVDADNDFVINTKLQSDNNVSLHATGMYCSVCGFAYYIIYL